VITWLNFKELLGVLAAMGLVFSGLWHGFPAFRYLMSRVARNRRGSS
jgi:hypothetical protein